MKNRLFAIYHRLCLSGLGLLLSIIAVTCMPVLQEYSIYFLYISYLLGFYYTLTIPWMRHQSRKIIRYIVTSIMIIIGLTLPGSVYIFTYFNQALGLDTSSPSATLGKALYQFSINNDFGIQSILTLSILFSWLYGSWLTLWIIDIIYLRKILSESI